MKKTIIFSIAFGLMFWFLSSPSVFLLAQDQNQGSENFVFLYEFPENLVPAPEAGDFGPYVNGIVKLVIGSAGVLAVIVIIIGGLQYMTTDAVTGKQEGKEKIWRAVLGLILAMASWIILYTINPYLVSTALDLNDATVPGVATGTPPGGDGDNDGAEIWKITVKKCTTDESEPPDNIICCPQSGFGSHPNAVTVAQLDTGLTSPPHSLLACHAYRDNNGYGPAPTPPECVLGFCGLFDE